MRISKVKYKVMCFSIPSNQEFDTGTFSKTVTFTIATESTAGACKLKYSLLFC